MASAPSYRQNLPPGEALGNYGPFFHSTDIAHYPTWVGRMISSPTVGRDVLAGTIHWNAFRNQDVATPHQSAYGRQLPPGGSREGICGTFCNSPYLVVASPTGIGEIGKMENPYCSTSWQNRSIFCFTSSSALHQKALSVRSMPATLAVSSAVATVVV